MKNEDGKADAVGREGRRPHPVRQWSGTEVKVDGEDLLIMKDSDILGIIEGTPTSKKKAAE